jgi:hypothetical protein
LEFALEVVAGYVFISGIGYWLMASSLIAQSGLRDRWEVNYCLDLCTCFASSIVCAFREIMQEMEHFSLGLFGGH